MRIVTTGMTRVVVQVGPVVVKLPRASDWETFLSGMLGNIREARASRTGWPELCPVLFALPCRRNEVLKLRTVRSRE